MKIEFFVCVNQMILIAGAARFGNFTGKSCTYGGKMMANFLRQFHIKTVIDCLFTLSSFTDDLPDLRVVSL